MIKILWIANAGFYCSFDTVTKLFIPALVDYIQENNLDLDIYVMCTGIGNKNVDIDKLSIDLNLNKDKIYLIPSINNAYYKGSDNIEFEHNYFKGLFVINEFLDKIDPTIIINLNDTEPIKRLYNSIKDLKYKKRFIPYLVIDCDNIPYSWVSDYKNMIVTTQFGKDVFQKVLHNCNYYIMPHIVDGMNKLSKLEARNILKIDNNKFIVGSINTNHVRKRWDILIESFCKFAINKKDVLLLLKINRRNKLVNNYSIIPYNDHDIDELIDKYTNKYNINKNVFHIIEGYVEHNILEAIYSCCDIGLFTTSGEGWGMTPMEMALFGTPSIIPNNTTMKEVFRNSKALVDTIKYPRKIGRDWGRSYDDTRNIFICIFKIYPCHQYKFEERYTIDISEKIDTIIISPFNKTIKNPINLSINVLAHVNNVDEAFNFYNNLDENKKMTQRIQFLINIEYNFLNIEYDSIINIKKYINYTNNMYYQILDNVYIDELATFKYSSVDIPKIDSIVDRLNLFYNDKNILESEGNKMRLIIKKNFNKERVIKKMVDIINNITNII